MASADLTLQDVFLARRTTAPVVRRTPLIVSEALSVRAGVPVHLKLENLQETGAFKVRGAANKILNLSPEERKRGIITVSTGNHGRAVAFVAKGPGIPAAICVSERVPENKIKALVGLGAEVIRHGHGQDDAAARATQLVEARGLTLIHPFDDPHIIAGQGTIALELLEDLPAVDTVLVPVSGGGLVAGIGLVLKTVNPAIRVIGVSMERAPVMYHSLKAGHPVQLPEEDTLADSLSGGIGLDNQYTYTLARRFVDDIVLVSEAGIAAAMLIALHEHNLVIEGAGAVGIAALLQRRRNLGGGSVAVVVSGGNVAISTLLELTAGYGG